MSQVSELLSQAVAHHRDGRLVEAEALYRAVLERDPKNPDAVHLLGVARLRLGARIEALALLKQAFGLNAGLPGLVGNLHNAVEESLAEAGRLTGLGDWGEAAWLYRAVVDAVPDNSRARDGFNAAMAMLGERVTTLSRAGRWVDAAMACREMALLRPGDAFACERMIAVIPILLSVGLEHRNAGRTALAEAHFRMALRCDPLDPGALYFVGLTERDAGDFGVAAALFGQALNVDPSHAAGDALKRLAVTLYGEGRHDAALTLLSRLTHIRHRAGDAALSAAVVATESGNPSKALELVVEVLKRPPEDDADRDSRLRCAYYLIERTIFDDRLLEAIQPLARMALKDDPTNPLAAKILGFHLYYHKRWRLLGRLWRGYFGSLSLGRINMIGQGLPLWYASRFDHRFFSELAPLDEHLARLPVPTMVAEPRFGDGPVLYFSCDDKYWGLFGRRTVAEALRLAEMEGRSPPNLHVHVIDATADTIAELRRLGAGEPSLAASVEDTAPLADRLMFDDFRRTYYAAIRLVRLAQFLRRHDRPMCQFDVDCLLHADVREVLALYDDDDDDGADDVTLIPGARNGPSNEYQAGMVYVRPTAHGIRYMELVARYVAEYVVYIAPLWTLDQAALFCCHVRMMADGSPLRLGFFRKDAYDYCTFPHGEMHGKIDAFERSREGSFTGSGIGVPCP